MWCGSGMELLKCFSVPLRKETCDVTRIFIGICCS